MSIADSIVADHKGTIELAAREGSGTRVTIRLPLDLNA
ncbi:MAG: sensor histidine kinase [Proteobacteria bacterium]|nr:sensor histidine kinase [Pseudomonadota bacterium]